MDEINYEDFAKLDLRIGKINSCENHPNADKLFVMNVDVGEDEERVICAGLRGFYSVAELVGRKAVFVVNLAPRILRGIESNGMILAASNKDHTKVMFIGPERDIVAGSKVN